MASKTTLDTLYLVNDSTKKISIDITVGDEGQTSLLTLRLDKKSIIENHKGNLDKYQIGQNNELIGKVLKINAIITDTSRVTNLTFLNIKISGGVIPRNYPLYKTVVSEGDSAEYNCHIEFFKP
jgi:hypothetical protein